MIHRGLHSIHEKLKQGRRTVSAKTQDAPIKKKIDLEALRPDDMSWPDFLVMLLQIGAELEHALMVQYLYAAYSLGGERVAPEHREQVQQWQSSILTVAREEMGHLLTIQNLLTLLGGALNFGREDYPWDSPFYPAPFCLEPVTLDSLACYIFAEAPEDVPNTSTAYRRYNRTDKAKIIECVRQRMPRGKVAHHVDEIYEAILELVKDTDRIPDRCFIADSIGRQMSWHEFGKSYGPQDPPAVTEEEKAERHAEKQPWQWEARVILPRMATRTEAIAALEDVAGQGESPHIGDRYAEPSHFDRFLEIYQGLKDLQGGNGRRTVRITRPVVVNPSTRPSRAKHATYLSNEQTRCWAQLANARFRMLLAYLSHMYRLVPNAADPGARPGMLHRIFGEMYNIKALASLLGRMPAHHDPALGVAGVPFEIPYTLTLPDRERDRWAVHLDLYTEMLSLNAELVKMGPAPDGLAYLDTLRALDEQSMRWIEQQLRATDGGRITV